MTQSPKLLAAYAYCRQLANCHYENFPVASLLLPAHLRQAVSVIYAFARTADDIADEGDASSEQRLNDLTVYEQQLSSITKQGYQGNAPIFIALDDVIRRYRLPIVLFQELLSAFRQDVGQKRYQDDDAINDYCRRSANPIGRLLLHLNGDATELNEAQSDAICTGLQLINFYQDIQQDLHEHNRVYIPQSDFTESGLSEKILSETNSTKMAPIIRKKHRKIHHLLSKGYPLGARLRGRLGWEIRTVILCSILTLKQLSSQDNQSLYHRHRLAKHHKLVQAGLALFPWLYHYYCQSYLRQITLQSLSP